MTTAHRALDRVKHPKAEQVEDRLMKAAAGVEAEFTLLVDDRPSRPEDVFGDPRGFITTPMMHRTGRSFHLPNGSAIYFDTGVIEIASPVMELERGCFGRLARSMEVAIAFVRRHLDDWERRTGRRVRLQGFSTHYNVSVNDGSHARASSGRVRDIGWLLMHLLPAPVMLLGTNRQSTGVGVRPRVRRIEVTADFPPDPARLAATGAVIGGIVSAVSRWPDLQVERVTSRGLPLLLDFRPQRHSSRRGWVARPSCFVNNPFASAPEDCRLPTTTGTRTVREIALSIFSAFRSPIRRLADPFSYRLAQRLLNGAIPCWLDEQERPAAYDDVGRQGPVPSALTELGLARYERVMINAVEGRPLLLGEEPWTPVGVQGWSRVVFRRNRDGARTVLPLDSLVSHLERW